MDPASSAQLVSSQGIVGNADQGGRRQVTMIVEEVWREVCEELGAEVPPAARRANLMLSGISLEESRGKTLRVGPCRIRILGETRPCERMDEAHEGLRDTLSPEWRAGAFGEILDSGEIRVGDAVEWVDEPLEVAAG